MSIAGPNFSKPQIICPKCDQPVVDDGSRNLYCKCGEVLRWSEPITNPCEGCGGKYRCFCIPDEG